MDVEQLHVVLQQSFSPDAAVRKPAEDTIRNLKNIQGSVQLLLQVIAEHQVGAGCVPFVVRGCFLLLCVVDDGCMFFFHELFVGKHANVFLLIVVYYRCVTKSDKQRPFN